MSLEDLSLTTRLMIALLAAIAAALLISLTDAEGEAVPPLNGTQEERIIQLDRQAAEEAYVQHIIKLFNVWVTDYSEEPPKALKGARQARSAFERMMVAIDKREQIFEEKRKNRTEHTPERRCSDCGIGKIHRHGHRHQ